MSAPLKLVHVAPWVTTGGGIETLLRWHQQLDRAEGLDAWQLALFDGVADQPENRRASLRAGGRDSLAALRRKFAAAMEPHRGAVVVYHNAWGLPLFADLDHAIRRVAYLHAGPAYVAPFLPKLRGWLDGVVTINPALVALACAAEPALADRQAVLLPPVEVPAAMAPAAAAGAWTIGYAGRLERVHKRADQLVPFAAELERSGSDVRLEVLGDGALRPRLERELGRRAVFHGWKTGAEYGQVLGRWQAAVFFSDSEGGPLALVEAMAAGVLPFFPAIGGSLGDGYAAAIDPLCHYPPGDLRELVRRIREAGARPAAWLEERRQRARELAQRHAPGRFGADFAGFVRALAAQPRISRPGERRGRLADALPLGAVTRWLPGALWE